MEAVPNEPDLRGEGHSGGETAPEQLARLTERIDGIGHDLNNMLGTMLAYGSLVIEDLPTDHPDQGYMAKVVEAGAEARRLVAELLDVMRSVEPDHSSPRKAA